MQSNGDGITGHTMVMRTRNMKKFVSPAQFLRIMKSIRELDSLKTHTKKLINGEKLKVQNFDNLIKPRTRVNNVELTL